MKDKISLQRANGLHPKISQEVINAITAIECDHFPKNAAIRIVQGLRTFEQQSDLYTLGRTKVNPDGKSLKKPLGNIVTNAKAGSSFHNYGLAIDFAILYDKDGNGTYETLSWDTALDYDKNGIIDWQSVVSNFRNLGYTWGGDWRTFKDLPHIQKSFGYTWNQLLTKYKNKEFIPGTKYVIL